MTKQESKPICCPNAYSPVPPDQADHAFEEFFDSAFQARHASEEPYWLGENAKRILGLDSSVNPETFRNLIKGRTPDGKGELFTHNHPSHPCAWHRQHIAPGSVSSLWALGPAEIQQLAAGAHRQGVNCHVWRQEYMLSVLPWAFEEGQPAHHLYACFPACASDLQTPQLHTDVILINAAFRANGRAETISRHSRTEMESPCDHYFSYLASHFRFSFGEYRVQDFGGPNYQIIGVPEELYQATAKNGLQQGTESQNPVLCANRKATSREQLFACWHAQAEAFGWGCDEAKALTRCIKRERVCIDSTRGLEKNRGERRKGIKSRTDRLLSQQIERNNAKRKALRLKATANVTNANEAAQPAPRIRRRQPMPLHSSTNQQNQSKLPRLKM